MKRIFVLLFFILFANTFLTQTREELKSSSIATSSIISVTVGGDFAVSGSFPSSFTERIDQFITRIYNQAYTRAIGNIKEPWLIAQINRQFKKYPIRGIKLKRASGEIITIDLLKFRLNGDFKNNPYLKNDDVLIFPPFDEDKNFFTINGAVNKPGKYYFVDGDQLSDAIELAQGINKAYENIQGVEISRLNYSGNKIKLIKTKLDSDIPLQRGDQIRVLAEETQRKDFHVIVTGEVNMPGYIPITKNNTTLYNVIKSAGGIKPTGSLRRARLLSGSVASYIIYNEFGLRLGEQFKLNSIVASDKFITIEAMLMSRMSNLTEQDTSYFFIENQLRLLLDGNNIDFTTLNNKNSKASNFIVKDGDVIIIPKIDNTIYIFGQVAKTGKIIFKEGANYLYYIDKAGGLSEFSDDDIFVIKGQTREWISPIDNEVKIEPGDFIWVPKDPHRSFTYYLNQTSVYFSIIGTIATILLLLNQFGK
ncbi:MAG: SLBB domain-containing protein [Bacteroidetes bacterium]|nr:SLBB domain-containing protein [Bacteroidota bacterium]